MLEHSKEAAPLSPEQTEEEKKAGLMAVEKLVGRRVLAELGLKSQSNAYSHIAYIVGMFCLLGIKLGEKHVKKACK